jgi:hypothetical protein
MRNAWDTATSVQAGVLLLLLEFSFAKEKDWK